MPSPFHKSPIYYRLQHFKAVIDLIEDIEPEERTAVERQLLGMTKAIVCKIETTIRRNNKERPENVTGQKEL